ncbi:hypothetical protein WMY93_030734 [Mugilogobius chulae]|uniref:Uncharacterized protein n=1 Tax=Mugilogobius chulae TaxID=88201 RepID=A0AAW0MJS6_9GOBI
MGDENDSKVDLRLELYSENSIGNFSEDDWNSVQAEDDFTAKENPAQVNNEGVGALSSCITPLPVKGASAASDPEAVVDFLRSFLSQMGMTDTLACFQAEWHEMVKTGQIKFDTKQSEVVPDVYIQNRHLENELKNAQSRKRSTQRPSLQPRRLWTRSRRAGTCTG